MSIRRVIHKFPLDIPFTEIALPAKSQPLSVGVQDNLPVIWIERSVSDAGEMPTPSTLRVEMIPTGRDVPIAREFVGTVQLIDPADGSEFVGHIYTVWV